MIFMAINKVVYDGNVLIDLTKDSVTPETLAQGVTAHDSAGNLIVGAAKVGGLEGIGNEYLWEKRTKEIVEGGVTETSQTASAGPLTGAMNYVFTSDTYSTINHSTAGFAFDTLGWSQVYITLGSADPYANLKKYFFFYPGQNMGHTSRIYTKNANSSFTFTNQMPLGMQVMLTNLTELTASGTVIPSEHIEYVNSPDPNAYPVEDGYDYALVGKIGDLLKSIS